MVVADRLRIPVTDAPSVDELPAEWWNRALLALAAEADARKALERKAERANKRKSRP